MKRLLIAAGILASAIVTITVQGEPPRPNQVRPLMQAKLDRSQRLLEGIALGDLDSIGKQSQSLSLLAEEATWRVLQTPEYLRYSSDFRHAADAITDAARAKNLDGATLGYVQLTMTCINCHKHVRDVYATTKPKQ